MDQVFIKGLAVDAVIGVYDWERTIRQRLVFDLDMGWDIRPAAAGDTLEHTLNYAAISERVQGFVEQSSQLLGQRLDQPGRPVIPSRGSAFQSLLEGAPALLNQAVDLLEESERGRVSGLMYGSKYFGIFLGGDTLERHHLGIA